MLNASLGIKIIHENIDGDHEFKEAYKLLRNANNIHFLGFGYNDINLSRLKIDYLLASLIGDPNIRGTSLGLGKAECNDIMTKWNGIKLCDNKFDVIEYLKNEVSFR